MSNQILSAHLFQGNYLVQLIELLSVRSSFQTHNSNMQDVTLVYPRALVLINIGEHYSVTKRHSVWGPGK